MIIPLLDYLVIKEVKNKLTETSIIVPDEADVPYSIKGEILALGEKVTLPLKIGDVVLFKRYGFEEIMVDKIPYLVGKEDNIYAKSI